MKQEEQLNDLCNRIKNASEFVEDVFCYEKCKKILRNYSRFEAIEFLQKLINRYKLQINVHGLIVDGICVIHNADYSDISDITIKRHIAYLGEKIFVYALMREGQQEAAKTLFNHLERFRIDL